MRTIGRVLLLLALACPASAQIISPNQSVSALDTGTACVTTPTACASWNPGASNTIALDVSGTFSGTLTFEATANGGIWNSVLAITASSGSTGTTTTTTGTFIVSNVGFVGVRVRATAWSSGTASVSATRGFVNARLFQPVFGGTLAAPTMVSLTTTVGGVLVPDGAIGTPTLAFSAATGTGFYRVGSNTVGIVPAASTNVITFDNTSIGLPSTSSVAWANNGTLGSSGKDTFIGRLAAGSISVNNGTVGLELNVGTPTLGTCTGGSLTSGSHNFGGEITGNTSGSCILNFGVPNFTNAPFCTLNDETNLVAARVSARSASSITITGLTSGDAVQYVCFGRI